jgi:uncharacterized protein YndB with AHSA1/START domain
MNGTVSDLVIKRTFNCGKRTLFEAWSTPSIMARWLYARQEDFRDSTVRNSFTVGGAYSIVMHLDGDDVHIHGDYSEIERYQRIAFTWSSPAIHGSVVTLDFRELSPNRTELTLCHSLFPSAQSRAAHDGGWHACLDHLITNVLGAA